MPEPSYFDDTHRMVRDTVRSFVQREILPYVNDWGRSRGIPRELYKKAAEAGILGIGAPEKWGGSGEDVFMKVAACEEMVRCTSGGVGASLGSLDIGLPPVWKWGSKRFRRRWCRRCWPATRSPRWRSPSRAAAPTWPTCAPARYATATTMW